MHCPAGTEAGPTGPATRWAALVFLALAQLMIALDATIMSVALPSVQANLGFADADRQWVITGYTLAFGALLLLGGRVADRIGRDRAFLIGLAGFATASAASGMATGILTLTLARAAQGAFGALLAPTVLSLIAVTFTEPRERARAFAIFGAIAGGGGATGLLLGGLLTETLGWRACLYVNVPVAVVAALGVRTLRGAGHTEGGGRLDVPGAVLATTGLVAIVFGCSRAATLGWRSIPVVGLLVGGLALLAGFAAWERRVPAPLLPPRILADRNRIGAYLAVASSVAGLLGSFLLLTYFVQVILGYDAIHAGLAFLPLSVAVVASSQLIAARLGPKVAPRTLIVPGMLVAATGMALLTTLSTDSQYLTGLLPAEILLGLGVGVVFTPAISAATSGIAPRDAGIAAAVVGTAQQIGGSVGVALLNTVAATATAGHCPGTSTTASAAAATVHGYTAAAGIATAIVAEGALLAAVLITATPHQQGRAR
jgi:EmrB/QacA subfamily drug resistance transporter